MRYEPHEYQEYAIKFILSHPIAAILLEMGLGKSVITLTAIFDLTLDSFLIRKVLVIAPLRVARDTWPAEIEKWDHLNGLTYSVAIGSEAQRKAALLQRAQVYLINRENVDWLINDSGIPFDYDMVVIDELSSFKSHTSKRFRALRKVRPNVKRIVGLTGTPSSNGLMDLWAEIGILDMGQRLGRYISHFRNTYFVPDKRNQQIIFTYKPKPGAEEAIYRLISDITISMKNTDYLKLPDLVLNEIPVLLSEDERQHYEIMKSEMVLSLKGTEIDAVNAAALSNKLLQMANGAVYVGNGGVIRIHDRKLDALEDIIEAANGKPVLIAFSKAGDMINLRLIISPFALVKHDVHNDSVEFLWPKEINYEFEKNESLDFQDDGKLYLTKWIEDPDYREEIIVRDAITGQILERSPGYLRRMPDGSMWKMTSK